MKLKQKLTAAFAAVLIPCLIVIGFTVSSLSLTKQDLNSMYETGLHTATNLTMLSDMTQAVRVHMVTAVLMQDPSQADSALELLDHIQSVTAETAELDLPAAETEALAAFSEQWGRFDERVRLNAGLIGEGAYAEAQEGLKIGAESFVPASEALRTLTGANQETMSNLKADADNGYAFIQKITWIAVAIALLFALAIAYFFSRSLARRIQSIQRTTAALANGDLTSPDLAAKGKDELTELSVSVNNMKQNLHDLISQTSDTTLQVSANAEELAASAEQGTAAAETVARLSQETAEDADVQQQNMGEMTASIEEMASLLQSLNDTSIEMNEHAQTVSEKTEEGQSAVISVSSQMSVIARTVTETNVAIEQLDQKSNQIGDIINMITAIADQTNLLALNAAIEAARAGEHGRGFAVVADEVRKLAEQSKESAAHIQEVVQQIQTEVQTTADNMTQNIQAVEEGIMKTAMVTSIFDDIRKQIQEVTQNVQDAAASTKELASGSDAIVSAIDRAGMLVEKSVNASHETSAASEEQLATTEQIAASAQALAHLSDELQQAVSRFKV